jgi:hypothetical protein
MVAAERELAGGAARIVAGDALQESWRKCRPNGPPALSGRLVPGRRMV